MNKSEHDKENDELVATLYLLMINDFLQYIAVLNNVFLPKKKLDYQISNIFKFSIGNFYAFSSLECTFPSNN